MFSCPSEDQFVLHGVRPATHSNKSDYLGAWKAANRVNLDAVSIVAEVNDRANVRLNRPAALEKPQLDAVAAVRKKKWSQGFNGELNLCLTRFLKNIHDQFTPAAVCCGSLRSANSSTSPSWPRKSMNGNQSPERMYLLWPSVCRRLIMTDTKNERPVDLQQVGGDKGRQWT